MKATFGTTKKGTWAYIQKSVRIDGKSTTKTVRRLGLLEDIRRKYGCQDPRQWVRDLAARMTEEEKAGRERISVDFYPGQTVGKGDLPLRAGGDLMLLPLYNRLGLPRMCAEIKKASKAKFDLDGILRTLVTGRLLFPCSKQRTLRKAQGLVRPPKFGEADMYRALSLLSGHIDDIQAGVYACSARFMERRDRVIYYDCTNYYFESEEESGLRQYGHSKENRPNPIVQMGLFTDKDGIPLAFCVNPGNTAETTTLKPLEDKLREKFGISKVVVCTDGGLASYENRLNDHVGERAFITVQSLKKIEKHLQEWALKTTGWKIVNFEGKNGPGLSENEYDLTQLDPQEYADALFCRERWIKTTLSKTGEELSQRLIVTFSFKYRDYLRHTRGKQTARAESIIRRGAAGKLGKGQNDPKRFIKCESCTIDGEPAQYNSYSLNQEMIDQEARFDGFYGICTDLDDTAPEIIKVNGGRWIIEDCFRITKTEFEARPVFLRRDDRIKAHFLTCFLALLLYKYLEKKVNRGGKRFSPAEIIDTLQDMNFLAVSGEGYVPTYTRTDVTNNLHGSAGFRTDTQIVSKQRMKAIIAESKKSTKKD